MSLVDTIYDAAIADGGCTFNLHGKLPSCGYMVGMYPERTVKRVWLCPNAITRFISDNYEMLRLSSNYLGIWYDDGNWYIDVSKCIKSYDDAIVVARTHDQQAIYELNGCGTIEVP